MFSEPVVASLLLLVLLVAGEVVSILTRARVPMLLVVLLGYLLLLWTGVFPKNIVETSTLATFGSLMIAPLIVHMGTLVPLKIIKAQIRAVAIALSGVIAASLLILLIVTPIFDYGTAVAGTGPLTGGTIAYLITAGKLQNVGLETLVPVAALILSIQGLIGMPLASFFLRRHASSVKKALASKTHQEIAATAEAEAAPAPERKGWIPERFQTQTVYLLQIFLGGTFAVLLGKWTGISYSIWALLIGLVGALVGFYRDRMMERANSFGIAMAALIFLTMASMNNVTVQMFVQTLPRVLVIMFVGVVGLLVGGYFASKALRWNPNKGVAVALTALFGFPGDYLLCEEVSRSVADNEEERKNIFDEILTPMLVGGFTTVTIASVVIASILVKTI